MAYEVDPTTQVYNAIWDAFDDSEYFREWVRKGNRVKLSSGVLQYIPQAIHRTSGPAVAVEWDGGSNHLWATSDNHEFTLDFTVRITVASNMLYAMGMPTFWAVQRALILKGNTLGLDFVFSTELGDLSVVEHDRVIELALPLTVTLYIAKSDI